jgi:hypothetical protein
VIAAPAHALCGMLQATWGNVRTLKSNANVKLSYFFLCNRIKSFRDHVRYKAPLASILIVRGCLRTCPTFSWCPMDEKRQRTRTRVCKDAMLISEHDSEGRHCVVSDITNGGARLLLAHPNRLPSTFSLTFDNFRSERVCRVIWRTVDAVGVRFINR